MGYFYTNPDDETDPNRLPDAEVFYAGPGELNSDEWARNAEARGIASLAGWYWWYCFPGCMPDGDPMGPFDSSEEAVEDARG